MKQLEYDATSVNSILEYAKRLTDRSLSDCVDLPVQGTSKNRGDLGSLVEKYFFKYSPNSNHGPDFPEAGLELKTTGVIKDKKGYKAKERLVLKMINFMTLVDEDWKNSSLINKCRQMLLLIYLYQKEVPVYKQKFVIEPLLFNFPEEDLSQIQRDWEFIQNKVKQGLAHELSEGDTFYLGACRKGSGGPNEKPVQQPFSNIRAKSRAFSLKQGYVTKIINGHINDSNVIGTSKSIDLEKATEDKFAPYIGKPIEEVGRSLNINNSAKQNKGFHRQIAMKIVAGKKSNVPEFDKAGIEMKTIRLNKSGVPRESMSFPNLDFVEILNEKWEDSNFFKKIEKKFLFVIFSLDADGIERLDSIKYWNMPYSDRLEAKSVWQETKRRIKNAIYDLPKESENMVAHVRPKARNAADKAPYPDGTLKTKQCFWLNKKYIAKIVDSIREVKI